MLSTTLTRRAHVPGLLSDPPLRRLTAVAAATALLFPTLVACDGSDDKSCDTSALPGLAVAVGGRANSPAMTQVPPAELTAELDTIIEKRTAAVFLQVDGAPQIVCSLKFSSNSVEPKVIEQDKKNFVSLASQVAGVVRANDKEADVLGALSLAAATAGQGGTVILMDSGLQTVAPLDMRDAGVLEEEPDRVVDELVRLGQLPNLGSRKVILIGLGYTAPPQQRLDEFTRNRLIQLWTAIVARASGGIPPILVTGANTNEALGQMPAVSLVPVAEIRPDFCNTEQILSDTGPVGFVPDQATFIDPTAANQVLSVIAGWLTEYPSAHADVTGNVAHHGSKPGPDSGLAMRRAQAVTRALLEFGASPKQVTPHGGGWGPYPTPEAPADKRYDQANRRVIISISC